MIKKSAVALAAFTACSNVMADPVSIFAAVASWYGQNMLVAHLALLVVTSAYTSSQARKAKRKAEAEARAQHNESLETRSATVLTSSPAFRAVYGRCIVGGDILAVFTSDKVGRDAKGRTYTKADGYKHVVIKVADHEVHAIHGAYWGGNQVGPLSGIGWPTYSSGNGGIPVGQDASTGWATLWIEERTAIINGDTKLPYKVDSFISAVDTAGVNRLSLLTLSTSQRRVTGPSYDVKLKYRAIRDDFVSGNAPISSITISATSTSFTYPVPGGAQASSVVSAWFYYTSGDLVEQGDATVTLSPDRRTFNIATTYGGGTLTITYTIDNSESKLKFSFHTGSPDQVPDAFLMSTLPEKWTANHLLVGKAYAVVTFDLEDTRFQGGPTEVSFDVSGKKVWDPRTGTHTFTRNNALIGNDYLRLPWGVNVEEDDIEQDYLIAAANVCDTENTFTETDPKWGTVTTTTGPLYTFNGLITSDESKEAIIAGIAQSMAGSIVDSSQWLIIAGAWTPPVQDLTGDDLFGSIEVVQGDNGAEDTFNAVRARYVPAGETQPADMTPYVNATLVAADGADLYDNQEYKYTDSNARCLNLARIHTELSRTGLVIKFPAKTSAWPLQIGDRVRVKTSTADFGFDYKTFRLTDWQHTLQSPVLLTLQEDVPETYDTVDTALADPTKDISLRNPWSLDKVVLLPIESGTEHLVENSSGGVMVRALVSWVEPDDPYVANGRGRVEVWYRSFTTEGVPEETWYRAPPSQGQNGVYINNLADRQLLEVQVYAVNALGLEGPSTFMSHLVVGRTAPPSDVTGLNSSVSQGLIPWSWDYPPDLDYAVTEVRAVDANWGSLDVPPLWRGKANSWPESVSFAATFVRYFRHVDTGGRPSVNTSTRSQIVDLSDLGPDVSTYRLDISPVAGVLYSDYRAIVTDFSTANAVVKVRKSDGTDDTLNWALTKTDDGIATTLGADGALTVLSYAPGAIDESYAGSMARLQFNGNLLESSRWQNEVRQVVPGDPVLAFSSGGPFTGVGYMQTKGSGGSTTGLIAIGGPNFSPGFRTNWSLSAWVYITEYPATDNTQYFACVGSGKHLAIAGGPGSTNVTVSCRYFGHNAAGGQTSSSTGQAATSAVFPKTSFPLNQWVFIETTWSSSERTIRLFKDGVLSASNTVAYDLATLNETYTYTAPRNFILFAGCGPNYEQVLRQGRLSDLDYTCGGSVRTATYALPTSLRRTLTNVAKGSTEVTATAGTTVLQGTYSVNTVDGAPAVIQLVLSRSSGIVKSTWNAVDYSFADAAVSVQVLVNGRNDTNAWDIFVNQYQTTDSISFSASNVTKLITVSAVGTADDPALTIALTNPNYPTQYVKYPVNRVRDPKPAQTHLLTKTTITLAGDHNGLATDFTQATTQGVIYEGGTVASGWSWAVSVTSGITYTHSNGLVTVTAMDQEVDQGSITLTATKSGWTTTVLRCEVVKTKVLLPSGQVVANMSPISVYSTAGANVPASASIRFKADGTIDYNIQGGGFISKGRWYNPTGGTPGTSYSARFGGAWYSLSSDLVLSVSATGEGTSDIKAGLVTFAATSNLTTTLGTCQIYLECYVTPGGA